MIPPTPRIHKSIITFLVFLAAYIIFSPIGLGWAVTAILIAYITFNLIRPKGAATVQNLPGEAAAERPTGKFWTRKDLFTGAPDTSAAPAALHGDQDCGLTHAEREAFNRLVRGFGDPE